MKSAPFSILPVLYTNLLAGALIGGVLGALLGPSSITAVFAGMVCGFIPLAVGGWLRTNVVKILASTKNIDAPVPYAFPLPVRLLIAAVLALIVSYIALDMLGYPLNFITGMLIGIFSAILMIIVMAARMMTK